MLLHSIPHTGKDSQPKIIWLKMSILIVWGRPDSELTRKEVEKQDNLMDFILVRRPMLKSLFKIHE